MIDSLANYGYSCEQMYYAIGYYLVSTKDFDEVEHDMDIVRRHIYRMDRENQQIQNQLLALIPAMPAQENVKLTVTATELEKIPKMNFSDVNPDIKKLNDGCAICQEEFTDSDVIRHLKCDHIFHIECIDTWLTRENYKCPNCREPAADHVANV